MSPIIEQKKPVFAYYRLSKEDSKNMGESESISNQRNIVESYCKNNNFYVAEEFVDDGYSGSNFDRPAFQRMIDALKKGKVSIVITKDLSRLGRDMKDSCGYVAETFPEMGVRYLSVTDSIDSEKPNSMLPFFFAFNDSYLRECSHKVREVLKNKRENGAYCACSPYGYKKQANNKNKLEPDEETAPVVRRIFDEALAGCSARAIALHLTEDCISPPLKYRVENGGNFGEEGASRASSVWNYTTVKRILKNRVYLGHTVLGKSKKVSHKSSVKRKVPSDEWVVTLNTHEALVTEEEFQIVQDNMLKNTRIYQEQSQVRNNIFSGLVFCQECGHALCSGGTVYKGEREKYWYLSCSHIRKDIANPCPNGARIYYPDLVKLVKRDLNRFVSISDSEIQEIVQDTLAADGTAKAEKKRQKREREIKSKLDSITKSISKVYLDNASGLLSDDQKYNLIRNFNEQIEKLTVELEQISTPIPEASMEEKYKRFYEIVRKYNHIDELNRDIVVDFIERIEVGPKIYPDGIVKATHKNTMFKQVVTIYYKFIGDDKRALSPEELVS